MNEQKNKFYLFQLIFYSLFQYFSQTPICKLEKSYFITNMKKLLHQKQFVTRDHYFLPEDNQSDTQSYKERSFHDQKVKKSQIQINNFTENMNIKINIKIDDQDFSQLKVVSGPSKWKKPDQKRISKESNQFFHTSIKNPQTNRKNKRYYNTELFSPFPQNYKNPQQRKQENNIDNFNTFSSKRSQKSNQFSSVLNNNFKQKPFFPVHCVQKSDKVQEYTTIFSPKQQPRQYKEVYNKGRIQVREQVSLDYFSSENSKNRLKTIIWDKSEKEVESQIYVQNPHTLGVQHLTSSDTGMQQYFFPHSPYNNKTISVFSNSGIYQESNSIEEKLNPPEMQTKTIIQPAMIEKNDTNYIDLEGCRIDFQPEDINASLTQLNKDKNTKINSTNTKPYETINLQMYEFTDPQLVSPPSRTLFPIQVSQSTSSQHHHPNPSLRSLHHHGGLSSPSPHSSLDKLSQIDKLRQLQIEVIESNMMARLQLSQESQLVIQSMHKSGKNRREQVYKEQEEKGYRKSIDVIGEESQMEQEQGEKGGVSLSIVQKDHTVKLLETQKKHNVRQQFSPKVPPAPSSTSIKSTTTTKKPSRQMKQEGYSKRQRSKSKQTFIPFSTSKSKMHHHREHCIEPSKPQPFIFQDYSSRNKKTHQYYQPQISTERSSIRQQSTINKPSPRKEPKVVKANLVNKKAEDLFTKHKNQFLYKLKIKQNSFNRTISTEQKSKEKSSKQSNLNKNIKIQSSSRNRSISPYVKQLSQRLHSHDLGSVCWHYQKHSKRLIRQRFFSMISQNHGNLLKQYYLSNDQLHEIFVNQILNKQMNENYWIEIVKRQGQRKLQNLRLKSKSKHHPNQRSIIKNQQVTADTKRAYPFAISVLSNSLQKVKAY